MAGALFFFAGWCMGAYAFLVIQIYQQHRTAYLEE